MDSGGDTLKKGGKNTPCKVKFAFRGASVTDISTHTDATACRNVDIVNVSL